MATHYRNTGIDQPPYKLGVIFGAASFVAGYLMTLAVITIAEAEEITDDLFEGAGWIYYNAQFAPLEISVDEGFRNDEYTDLTVNYVTGTEYLGETVSTEGPAMIYHLIPVVVLVGSGFVLAKKAGAVEVQEGVIAGATLVSGTTVLALVGTVLFSVSNSYISVDPAVAESLLFVGILFPAVFGSLGGILATKR